uniref:Ribosomal protein L32 n=1 Tax=Epimedium sutchuenense TaxID=471948 RepID=A0A8K1HJ56_9MAGN|nr:ribosomal protein L32 [Epimedium sutchuenense]UBN06142.1 ribosomal protein L32 [Epimedium sutchuenense]
MMVPKKRNVFVKIFVNSKRCWATVKEFAFARYLFSGNFQFFFFVRLIEKSNVVKH